jgi:hypoxanthine phosphoribosyltransferase
MRRIVVVMARGKKRRALASGAAIAERVPAGWNGADASFASPLPEFRHFRGDAPPRFGHPVELEFAKLLDFYGMPWQYEPTTFPLEWEDDGSGGKRVTRAFTPDFYLPEQDLYIETTVMKQSLVTRKNRKLRELRVRYPEVRIKLFYRRDFEKLAQRFGFALPPPGGSG